MVELKPIAKEAIPRALERAERYRLLNEPRLAESICLDVLEIQSDNQAALSCLLLALTDQFGHSTGPILDQAKQILPRLASAYERVYYAGIINERFARQQLLQSHPGANFAAYEYLREAIVLYDRADAIAPDNNDDAILRHNTCVRMIQWHRLIAPHREEREQPLE
jgi:hypothetical protein